MEILLQLPLSVHVRPCAQGRCGRCPPVSGVMSDLFFFFFTIPVPASASLTAKTHGPPHAAGASAGARGAHASHAFCSVAGGGGRARLASGGTHVGEYSADMCYTEGPDKACSSLGRQMMFPRVAHAVRRSFGRFIGSAGQAERNLKGLTAALCPVQGASCCGSGGAASMDGMRSSATGMQQRKTCQRSSWTARRGCFRRSSSCRGRRITCTMLTCCQT